MSANQYEVNSVIDADRATAPIRGNLVAGRDYMVQVNPDGTTSLVRP